MGQGDAVAVVEDGKTYKFYDNGGEGNYTNNANDLLTIKPANPNGYIRCNSPNSKSTPSVIT